MIQHTVETLRHTAIHNPPRVAESDAESVTDDDRQPHETKGTPEMTTEKRIEEMTITELLRAVDDQSVQDDMREFMRRLEVFDQKALSTFRNLTNIRNDYAYALDVTDELTAIHRLIMSVRRKQRTVLELMATLDERSALAV